MSHKYFSLCGVGLLCFLLCRSDYFNTMFSGTWKESNQKYVTTYVVTYIARYYNNNYSVL